MTASYHSAVPVEDRKCALQACRHALCRYLIEGKAVSPACFVCTIHVRNQAVSLPQIDGLIYVTTRQTGRRTC